MARTTKLARAAKACKGKPGSAFRSCVKSHMAGLGRRPSRRRHSRR
jgi:hypothetical protein